MYSDTSPAPSLFDPKPINPSQGARAVPESYRSPRLAEQFVLLALLLLVGTLRCTPSMQEQIAAEQPAPTSAEIPLTFYTGQEDHPAFSPSGDRIAFTWDGPSQDNFDIYVSTLDETNAASIKRLTFAPERDFSPAWSPDGSRIAFLRQQEDGRTSVILLSTSGSETRNLGQIFLPEQVRGRQLSWSPDGAWLVLPDCPPGKSSTLSLLSVATGQRRPITSPPNRIVGDFSPALSSDGRLLVFVRYTGEISSDLYLLEMSAESEVENGPRRLTNRRHSCESPIWLNDTTILYSVGVWPSMNLRRIDLAGGEGTALTSVYQRASSPAYSTSTQCLVFSRLSPEINIWQLSLDSPSHEEQHPVRRIASSRLDWLPTFSNDGTQIVFSSQRSGYEQLWLTQSSKLDALPLTRFRGSHCGSATWSPDDTQVAFHACIEGECSIFIKKAEVCFRESPRCNSGPCCLTQLTPGEFESFMPSWSRDGNWIYFASGRSGQLEIWKVSPGGGPVFQVTKQGGLFAQESIDGRSLFYTKQGLPGIWRMSKDGTEEEKILDQCRPRFAVTGSGIYYVCTSTVSGRGFSILFYDFSTETSSLVLKTQKRYAGGITVSPDQKAVLWSQFDRDEADLVKVEEWPSLGK